MSPAFLLNISLPMRKVGKTVRAPQKAGAKSMTIHVETYTSPPAKGLTIRPVMATDQSYIGGLGFRAPSG